jgi:hypothetical protein
MDEQAKRSKKRSGGKQANQPQLSLFTVFYLDENICNCREILSVLDEAKVAYKRHLDIYPRADHPNSVPDEIWLEMVGRNGWAVLTADKRNRYEPLEKAKIIEHKVREFTFASGNFSGADMAEILKDNLRRIDRMCRFTPAPLIVSLSKSGISVRFPQPAKPLQRAFRRPNE